ncbi:MAG: 3-methyl-2-oxobutanoate dehydrogenase subunit VorB [Peptococcaceae bacterium]|nr:3-methyl-2-oxobutanoate dehydrogenase subunit VorB [Peptococcaceae bacterium]MDH7526352.1 3-methyl-2-oxobutanoate dehydrogenase subunit VorB [Peptococcaceae bacterium]
MEKLFMKGNEAIAEAALRAGCSFFAGYPITPQNEIPEYMSRRLPELGGVFIQGESEVASINMLYGASAAGKRAMTSSSGPGLSLKAEGISYLAGAALPAVIVYVMRAGPGLGHIMPGQNDYFQATKAPGHGGFKIMVMAPSTVQEAVDLTCRAFDYADRDRNPVMVLVDGVIGAMMESVTLPPYKKELPDKGDWIADGCRGREPRLIRSFILDALALEDFNKKRAGMYERWQREDAVVEEFMTDDAEYVIAAYGTSARVARTSVRELRKEGLKAGLIRPATLVPFPYDSFAGLGEKKVKGILVVEMTIPGQMIEDVRLGVGDRLPVYFLGRSGGVIVSPLEVKEKVLELAGGGRK